MYLTVASQGAVLDVGNEFGLFVDHQVTPATTIAPGAVRDLVQTRFRDSTQSMVFSEVGGEPGATAASLLMAAFTPLNPPAIFHVDLDGHGAARTALVGAVHDFAPETPPQVRRRRRRRYFSGAAKLHGVNRDWPQDNCGTTASQRQQNRENESDMCVHENSFG
ncbi:hypothetical protein A3I99_04695 [Candidatus Kaiserbacteria bacterium RIFCSPLOWO2_02_FULL_45_11b]|uniref:Uncharacterized protein n=1 Tax=Candidatus Kaiserbacteria bacterium RIFCSPLOWO2_12_FULL_45_26 TaxID=1798525 RepID=A0A1F6FGT4_9BACT|nr:MAG: hypothetical protein A2Z56_03775 [Candidatus Kaiserbacteria bacterium RIFCSPHIGHO2_12_45_16]OGG69685.1 MAG: hypothetical protein A2929_00510 [Candidatus Kaiserbacteria bacterium RIFCSPLOWO2_01_FULL_45_25]OGG81477.1 MAG: hypothetical protein A3I99_04695 [Candidatus Kaiserbacteria bacterium RIFCSPLOWO2_02_FULL_45_11b]OGG85065.1 MAG: hypothetical protein A3G90_03320 [Candidatus Kaiserbacteria bacterium RIFCSPLOWO2_12_FULL_45_26]